MLCSVSFTFVTGELAEAIRSNTDIHFGLYYSLMEFFHPLYLEDHDTNNCTTQYYVNVSVSLFTFTSKCICDVCSVCNVPLHVCMHVRACVGAWCDQAGSGCPGVGLLNQQKGYTSCYPFIHFMQQRVLRTTLLSLARLLSRGPSGQNLYASNWLFNIPWPGGLACHMG